MEDFRASWAPKNKAMHLKEEGIQMAVKMLHIQMIWGALGS